MYNWAKLLFKQEAKKASGSGKEEIAKKTLGKLASSDSKADLQLPELRIPELEIPEIDSPEVDFQIPDVDISDVDLESPRENLEDESFQHGSWNENFEE